MSHFIKAVGSYTDAPDDTLFVVLFGPNPFRVTEVL